MSLVDALSQPAPASPEARSLWADARRRFLRNRAAIISLVLLAVIIAASIGGQNLTGHGYSQIYWDHLEKPPSPAAGFLLGTDSNGRDLLTRILHGGRISLAVGVVATLVSLCIGVVFGVTAGFIGGWVDLAMMRIVEVIYAIPFLFFVILLTVFFGHNILLIFVAIGAVEWLDIARIARGQTLSLKRREYVDAARALGVSTPMILWRHILPNLVGVLMIYVTLTVPKVILLESYLSFLGLGVQEPLASWGVLVSDGAKMMQVAPWLLIAPATVLTITIMCLNYLGDGLRDALDPKDRR